MTNFIKAVLMAGLLPWTVQALDEADIVLLDGHEVDASSVLAKLKENAPAQIRAQALEREGLAVRRQYRLGQRLLHLEEASPNRAASPATRAQALATRIERLRQSGLFEYVEPNYIVRPTLQPNDSRFQDGTLWGLKNSGANGGRVGADINAEQAWDITTGTTNVIVAVIDTGVRYTHQELAAQMWRNPDEIPGNGTDDDNDGYIDNVFGINAAGDTGDPMDVYDHGTHVAGTIGAAANSGGPHVGVAWNVRIMALKFLDPFGATADAIECLDFAVKEGVKISNNSWGGGAYSQALADAISAARSAGHLFIAAAGNDGLNNDEDPHYPSNYPHDNVISVAALDRADRLADFSNYGHKSVDIGAPGVSIFSSISSSDTAYDFFDGTSMAAPHVSGVAALLLARFPSATYIELRERLLLTAVPVAALSGRSTTGSRVNAYNALSSMPTGVLSLSVTPGAGDAVISPSAQSIFVHVTDLLSVANATVSASVTNNGAFHSTVNFINTGVAPDETANDGIYSATLNIPAGSTSLVLVVSASAPGKQSNSVVVPYTVITIPVNDSFDSAKKIPAEGGMVVSTTQLAGMEPGEPLHGGIGSVDHSLWYTWSPATSGTALLDPAGSAFDTVLAVYRGNNLLGLTSVASVDDVGTLKQGYLFFNATAGTTYRVAIAGKSAEEQGTFRLRAQINGLPDTNAPVVTIVAPANGTIVNSNQITLSGLAFDPTPNASGVSEVAVILNDDIFGKLASGTTNWSTTLFLQPGVNTLQVRARDYSANDSPAVAWSIVYDPVPSPNDHFVNATELTGLSGEVSADTEASTKEFGEPNHANNDGGKSVWWKFTPPSDGVLVLSTADSDFDTLLGLYTGTNVAALTRIASNDDFMPDSFGSRLEQAVLAGQTYRIAVDGYAGDSGEVVLTYEFTQGPVFLLNVSATAGGGVTPGTGHYANNAAVSLQATADPGYEFSAWSGSVSSTANPLNLNITGNLSVVAEFVPHEYADDFESGTFHNGNVQWDVAGGAGNVPWIVQSNDMSTGTFAARSGAVGHSQTSALRALFNSGGGMGSFDLRVSSEEGWDRLKFYVNDELVAQWSGEAGWISYQFPLAVGATALEWEYVKDASGTEGEDSAFIDNLDLPFIPVQVSMLLTNISAGRFDVMFDGDSGQEFYVQASTNLTTWETISTNYATNSLVPVVDAATNQNTVRFYRTLLP